MNKKKIEQKSLHWIKKVFRHSSSPFPLSWIFSSWTNNQKKKKKTHFEDKWWSSRFKSLFYVQIVILSRYLFAVHWQDHKDNTPEEWNIFFIQDFASFNVILAKQMKKKWNVNEVSPMFIFQYWWNITNVHFFHGAEILCAVKILSILFVPIDIAIYCYSVFLSSVDCDSSFLSVELHAPQKKRNKSPAKENEKFLVGFFLMLRVWLRKCDKASKYCLRLWDLTFSGVGWRQLFIFSRQYFHSHISAMSSAYTKTHTCIVHWNLCTAHILSFI